MKVSLFQQSPYRHLPEGFEERHPSVVTTPYLDLVDPELVADDLSSSVWEMHHAAREGLDGVFCTEHSQSSYDMVPNPTLLAATLAHLTEAEGLDVAIGVLGRSLGKSREPLKIAEEYALIDCLSHGRLIAGFPVGLSYDANQNGGIPPVETRERSIEARALIERAWTATEPFAFNGTYFRYPQVNLWPRPLQRPKPPVWVPSGGTPSSMERALRNDDVFTYLSWFGPKLTAQGIFESYWATAERLGKQPDPHRLAFLQVVMVSETDAEAERDYGEHLENHFRRGLGAIPPSGFGLPGYVDIRGLEAMLRDPSSLGLATRLKTISYAELADNQVAIVGGPETVRQQITDFVKRFRIGNLLVMLQVGSMPRELTERNITLFAREVLPHLRGIWADEPSDFHDWPDRLRPGRAAAATAGTAR
jgi:alkanesulfonate monooxygenase SsuD/methylene tetrahydromethanopterin reductase-like flavin-dependent oxidoreductase (luciferase family)